MFLTDFDFDGLAITYLLMGVVIMLAAAWFGRHTTRGETRPGRFYAILLLYAAGYIITILSGNVQLLFAGWEITGISSFLLMLLHRNVTTGNSAKAFFIYRLGDVGLLLAMWASHHLWRENTMLVSLMLLVTASAQASQLPFSCWLPQAMENSTVASALLLSTLTVSLGLYLLLRSMPAWEQDLPVRLLMAVLGLIGALMATGFANVQPLAKRRIAYSAIAHIGLTFIEVAAGLKRIALIHIAANTLWQAYRLMAAPKVVTPEIISGRKDDPWERLLPKRLKYSLYTLYWKEWGIYARLSKYLRE